MNPDSLKKAIPVILVMLAMLGFALFTNFSNPVNIGNHINNSKTIDFQPIVSTGAYSGASLNSWIIDGNTVYWMSNTNLSRISATPAVAVSSNDGWFEQYFNFSYGEESPSTTNISYVFRGEKPDSGIMYVWMPVQKSRLNPVYSRVNTTTMLNFVNSTEQINYSPDLKCSVGDLNNSEFYIVNFSSMTDILYCVNSISKIGEDSYQIYYSQIEQTGSTVEYYYEPDWLDLSSLFKYSFSNLTGKEFNIYTVDNITFNKGDSYLAKFRYYIPKEGVFGNYIQKNGKFDVYMYEGSPADLELGTASIIVGLDPWYNQSACGVINVSGIYNLTANLSSTSTCINITVSDVYLDGKGYVITGNSSLIGIQVGNGTSIKNVTIFNLTLKNVSTGINLLKINDSSIINVSTQNASFSSIYLVDGINNTVDCNGSTLNGNLSTLSYGVYSNEANDIVRNCNIVNYKTGVSILASSNTIISNNISSTLNSSNGIAYQTGPSLDVSTLGGTLRFWVDASNLSSITTDSNGFVSVWNDTRGTGVYLKNSTVANAPQSGLYTINGKNAIYFDGADGLGSNGTVTMGAYTWFVASKLTPFGTAGMVIEHGPGGLDGTYATPSTGCSIATLKSGGTWSAKDVSANWFAKNTTAVATYLYGGTHESMKIYLNGVDTSATTCSGLSSNPGSSALAQTVFVGSRNYAASNKVRGLYGEIILFDGNLTVENITYVTKYLMDKWMVNQSEYGNISNNRINLSSSNSIGYNGNARFNSIENNTLYVNGTGMFSSISVFNSSFTNNNLTCSVWINDTASKGAAKDVLKRTIWNNAITDFKAVAVSGDGKNIYYDWGLYSNNYGVDWNYSSPSNSSYNIVSNYNGSKVLIRSATTANALLSTNSGSTFTLISNLSSLVSTTDFDMAISRDGSVGYIGSVGASCYYYISNDSSLLYWNQYLTSDSNCYGGFSATISSDNKYIFTAFDQQSIRRINLSNNNLEEFLSTPVQVKFLACSENCSSLYITSSTGTGLYKSTDYGSTWQNITNFQNGSAMLKVSSDSRIIAILNYTRATPLSFGFIRVSQDYGSTWKNYTTPSIKWSELSMSENGAYIYLSGYNTTLGGSYVIDLTDNIYNKTSTGNIYYFINGTPAWSAYNISSNNSSTWANQGSDRPFNATTVSGYWSGGGADWYPYTTNVSSAEISCGSNITSSGTFNLTQNLSSNGGICINISGNNVTIDCKGYSITGNNSSSNIGVLSTGFNTTIKNCNIINFSNAIRITGLSANFSNITNNTINQTYFTSCTYATGECDGIWVNASSFSSIKNNTLSNKGYSILVRDSSNNTISDNYMDNISSYQIYLNFTNDSLVSKNRFNEGGWPIYVYLGTRNTIFNNNITNFKNYGISIVRSTLINVSSNYASGRTTNGIYAVHMHDSPYNIIENNSLYIDISAQSFSAVYLDNSSNINLTNNTIVSLNISPSVAKGLYLTSQSDSVIVKNNTFITNSNITDAIYTNALNGTFIWNNITADSWISDANGVPGSTQNNYNDSVSGNIYYFLNGSGAWTGYDISTNNSQPWANHGTSRPFSATTTPDHWVGYGNDWYPYTENTMAAPNITQIYVSPVSPKVSNNLSCYVNVTGTDSSSTVNINWFLNGINVSSLASSCTANNKTLTLCSDVLYSNLSEGQNWSCAAVASDSGGSSVRNYSSNVTTQYVYHPDMSMVNFNSTSTTSSTAYSNFSVYNFTSPFNATQPTDYFIYATMTARSMTGNPNSIAYQIIVDGVSIINATRTMGTGQIGAIAIQTPNFTLANGTHTIQFQHARVGASGTLRTENMTAAIIGMRDIDQNRTINFTSKFISNTTSSASLVKLDNFTINTSYNTSYALTSAFTLGNAASEANAQYQIRVTLPNGTQINCSNVTVSVPAGGNRNPGTTCAIFPDSANGTAIVEIWGAIAAGGTLVMNGYVQIHAYTGESDFNLNETRLNGKTISSATMTQIANTSARIIIDPTATHDLFVFAAFSGTSNGAGTASYDIRLYNTSGALINTSLLNQRLYQNANQPGVIKKVAVFKNISAGNYTAALFGAMSANTLTILDGSLTIEAGDDTPSSAYILPPDPVEIYNPLNQTYNTSQLVLINFSNSTSPSGLPITGYDVYLYYANGTQTTILLANTTNLETYSNLSGYVGQFFIRVISWQSDGKSATANSLNFTLNGTYACQNIFTPGNYTLGANITTTTSCFNIQSSNVNFSCEGNSITGNLSGNGITSDGENITIKNCIITNFSIGVYSTNSNNFYLYNNTIINVSSRGATIRQATGCSNNAIVSSNFLQNMGGRGINIYSQNSTLVFNNTIINVSADYAIIDEGSSSCSRNLTIKSNNMINVSSGIYGAWMRQPVIENNMIIKVYNNIRNRAIYLTNNGVGGTITNNTILLNTSNSTVEQVGMRIQVVASVANNTIIFNGTNTTGIENTAASSTYLGNNITANRWFNGVADAILNDSSSGNIYYFTNGSGAWTVYNISTTTSKWADQGTDRPFNSTKIAQFSGSGNDWFPYTENLFGTRELNCTFAPGVYQIRYNPVFGTGITANLVYPINQTNPAGVLQCRNNGSLSGNVYIRQNDTYSYVSTVASTDYFTTGLNLTNSDQLFYSNLPANSVINISLYRNYSNITATTMKTVAVNVSIR